MSGSPPQAIMDKITMLLTMMWPLQLLLHTYRKHIEEHPLKTNNSKAVIFRINTVTRIKNPLEKYIYQSICLHVALAYHPNLKTILNS